MELQKKLSNKIFHFYCSGNFYLRFSLEAPFYWKLLTIGIHSTKDIRKMSPVFHVWEFATALPSLPVFRVVLLPTELKVWRLFGGSEYIFWIQKIWKFCLAQSSIIAKPNHSLNISLDWVRHMIKIELKIPLKFKLIFGSVIKIDTIAQNYSNLMKFLTSFHFCLALLILVTI